MFRTWRSPDPGKKGSKDSSRPGARATRFRTVNSAEGLGNYEGTILVNGMLMVNNLITLYTLIYIYNKAFFSGTGGWHCWGVPLHSHVEWLVGWLFSSYVPGKVTWHICKGKLIFKITLKGMFALWYKMKQGEWSKMPWFEAAMIRSFRE